MARRTTAERRSADADDFMGTGSGAVLPSADDFLLGDESEHGPERKNVSGQPPARYEWRGKTNMGYLVRDPATGDFRRYKNGKPRGFTRCTTFNKAATDQNALNAWGKRNVVIGASMRPDLVDKAHGMTHRTDRDSLDDLVSQLETAAGAKVAASIGTSIHELTERYDGGVLKMGDVPRRHREAVRMYAAALKEHRLIPVQGLIERTTFVADFGGIVGTWDRVYLHEPSGVHIIGDVKTGKTLEYGMDEIETQEAVYARGFNTSGAYDWNTDTWERPLIPGTTERLRVSEEFGVVIHLPVDGDDAGTCQVVGADLVAGWRHAELCHRVREERAARPKPRPFDPSKLRGPEASDTYWDELFARASSKEELSELYTRAYKALEPMQVQRLVGIGRDRLRALVAADEVSTGEARVAGAMGS